jgi:aspartate-semialdehyde dehydrogenase
MRVAIVGATGAVGREMKAVLEQRGFPVSELRLLASRRSVGSDLLKRADELWKAGDKAAAAPLYRELRDKHKLTLLYLRNRGKIEERSDWKP